MRAMRPANGMPDASYSSRCQPVPTPRSSRPPDTTSSVAAIFASSTAGRSGEISTPVRQADARRRARDRRQHGERLEPGILGRQREPPERVAIGARAHHDVIGEVDLVDAGGLRLARDLDHRARIAAEQPLEAEDSQRNVQRLHRSLRFVGTCYTPQGGGERGWVRFRFEGGRLVLGSFIYLRGVTRGGLRRMRNEYRRNPDLRRSAHSDRLVSGSVQSALGERSRRDRDRRSGEARERRSGRGGTRLHGQRALGGHRPGAGAPGRDLRRHPRAAPAPPRSTRSAARASRR